MIMIYRLTKRHKTSMPKKTCSNHNDTNLCLLIQFKQDCCCPESYWRGPKSQEVETKGRGRGGGEGAVANTTLTPA